MTRRRWGFAAAAMLCVVAGVSPARAQAVHHTIATLALQHGVIGIEALSTGHVLIGASTDAGNATVSLAADAGKDLVDSITRITARRVGTRTTRVYRTVATDPATGAGVQFARHITKGASTYRLFFSTGDVRGFPLDVTSRELGLVLRALRRAVRTARTLAAADSA
jgi:hypothetical protein